MESLTRRGAIGLGILSGSSLFTTPAQAADEKSVIFVDEKAVLFKVKNVSLEEVDQDHRTIAVRFGKPDQTIKVANLPLGESVRIRASFVFPSSANQLPFHWDRLKGLVGKTVSMMLARNRAGFRSIRSPWPMTDPVAISPMRDRYRLIRRVATRMPDPQQHGGGSVQWKQSFASPPKRTCPRSRKCLP